MLCSYCGENHINCIGHFGHYQLENGKFQYPYIKYIIKILECICISTGKLLLDKEKKIPEDFYQLGNSEKLKKK